MRGCYISPKVAMSVFVYINVHILKGANGRGRGMKKFIVTKKSAAKIFVTIKLKNAKKRVLKRLA
jgi:hypothetical protein